MTKKRARKKTKPEAIQIRRVRDLLGQIEKQKQVMARERDKLRELVSDVDDIIMAWEGAEEDLDSGLRLLDDALSEMSTLL